MAQATRRVVQDWLPAWTAVGGKLLHIEVLLMPGTGKLKLTGQLGDVMQESAQAALSYVRAHAKQYDIPDTKFKEYDVHIHVPAGATSKEGPSAGVTMLTAFISAFTKRAVRVDYAMTGEIDLLGNVLRIGGLKEKVLAAKQNNIHQVIAPRTNQSDLAKCQDAVSGVEIIWVDHIQQVLDLVLIST